MRENKLRKSRPDAFAPAFTYFLVRGWKSWRRGEGGTLREILRVEYESFWRAQRRQTMSLCGDVAPCASVAGGARRPTVSGEAPCRPGRMTTDPLTLIPYAHPTDPLTLTPPIPRVDCASSHVVVEVRDEAPPCPETEVIDTPQAVVPAAPAPARPAATAAAPTTVVGRGWMSAGLSATPAAILPELVASEPVASDPVASDPVTLALQRARCSRGSRGAAGSAEVVEGKGAEGGEGRGAEDGREVSAEVKPVLELNV